MPIRCGLEILAFCSKLADFQNVSTIVSAIANDGAMCRKMSIVLVT